MHRPDDRAAVSRPLAGLTLLRTQLRLLVPLLAVGEGHPDTGMLLDELRRTLADVEGLLSVAEPRVLVAIREGLRHATAAAYNESRSEFLAAFHRLSILLQDGNPRRLEAADEPTERSRPKR